MHRANTTHRRHGMNQDKTTVGFKITVNWSACTVELRRVGESCPIVKSYQVTNHTVASAYRDLAFEALRLAHEMEHRGDPEEYRFNSLHAHKQAEKAIQKNTELERLFRQEA
jgi:hypothetical protein